MKAEQYAIALFEALREVKPEDHDRVVDNLARILQQNGDLELYPKIEEAYKRLEAKEKGIKEVEVITAQPLKTKELIHGLNNIIGSKSEIKEKVDQGIIGGVVIRVDDTLIDGSVKNSLKQLRKAITK